MFRFATLVLAMVIAGLSRTTFAAAPTTAPASLQDSVERGLTFLQKSSQDWLDGNNQLGTANGHPVFIKPAKVTYCASCHHLPITIWCMTEAKNHGLAVDEKSLNYFREWSLDTYVKDPDLKPVGQDKFGGSVLSLNTIYLSFAAAADPSPDEATRSALKKFAAHVIDKQEADGSWKAGRTGYEPPIGDVTDVLTMQALLVLATAQEKGQTDDRWPQARDRALQWLSKNPSSDRHQSLALRVLIAQRLGTPEEMHTLVKQLVERQNPDGGWSQVKDLTSDAMATGQSLYVLNQVSADIENKAAVESAQAFLLKTQRADGSWWVTSREKGRKSLASSVYGSGWATLGMIRTMPAAAAKAVEQTGRAGDE